jgi:pilus assembly protein Flp/PilA
MLKRLFTCDSGASALEYGIIASLIAIVIITAVGALGRDLSTVFENIRKGLVLEPSP